MLTTLAIILSLSGGTPAAQPAAVSLNEVDVELALAVDISGSMDYEEARVQRNGYIEAIRHPDFIKAIRSGLTGKIALSYYEWSGNINEASVIPWRIIETAADAQAFAAVLEDQPVQSGRGTSISRALTFGADLIEANDIQGLRRVIDVSGDGPNNAGPRVVPERDATIAKGIVINGLAILIRPSAASGTLDVYYRDCVIGGPGAFVVPVRKPEDFAPAIRRKLIQEVSGTRGLIIPAQVTPQDDYSSICLSGEKYRPFFMNLDSK